MATYNIANKLLCLGPRSAHAPQARWPGYRLKEKSMNFAVSPTSLSANPHNLRSIGERVEDWHSHGLPAGGLSASERAEVIADAQGSFMAEFVGKAQAELQALEDKELVATHYWAMHEATR